MRVSLALALAASISVSGCAMTTQQKRVGYAAGAALAVAGVAAMLVAHRPCDPDASLSEGAGCLAASLELEVVGLVVTALGTGTLTATALAPTLAVPVPMPTEAAPPVVSRGAVAVQLAPPASLVDLAERASIAAHGGRCVETAALADRIEMLDPDYRYGAFVKDAAIATCLQ